jgi:hypothetical protein
MLLACVLAAAAAVRLGRHLPASANQITAAATAPVQPSGERTPISVQGGSPRVPGEPIADGAPTLYDPSLSGTGPA